MADKGILIKLFIEFKKTKTKEKFLKVENNLQRKDCYK